MAKVKNNEIESLERFSITYKKLPAYLQERILWIAEGMAAAADLKVKNDRRADITNIG